MALELTFEDYLHLPELTKIAKFADKAEKAIKSHRFEFGIGNSEVEVLRGDNYGECYYSATLSIDCTWTYRDNWWGGRKYTMKCTGEGIFAAFKAQLLEEEDNTRDCALSEFKRWVESLPTWKGDSE